MMMFPAASGDGLVGRDTLAGAVVERPEVVVVAAALHADAVSGKYIELFIFVVAVSHLVAARAIICNVSGVCGPPNELTVGADEQF